MITIGSKQLCEYCLTENCGEPCCFCGYDKTNYKKEWGALSPGSILLGKYIVGKIIGQGGFGITYLAYDTKLEKKVALKEYYPVSYSKRGEDGVTVTASRSENEELYKTGMEKFYEEASLVSKFNGNPNIVSVYEFFYENDTAYFVMELLHGVSLKAYIDKQGCLSPEEMLYIADEVSNALMVAHSANVLHRDVSPDNIMLCTDGKVKLIDFGAARQVAADNPKSMSVILKQGFAPLEQYQKRGKQGPWTDLYTLGATLYYALTAECIDDPMTRLDDDSEFQANSHGIEPQLWELIRHALNLKIDDRYQDAFEFRAALNKIAYKPQEIKVTVPEQAKPINASAPLPVPALTAAAAVSKQAEPLLPTGYVQSAPAQSALPSTEYVQTAPDKEAALTQPPPAAKKPLNKKRLAILGSAAGVLIIAVITVLVVLLGKKNTFDIEIAGKPFPSDSEFVDLSNMGLTDDDLEPLTQFTDLKRVELSGNNLTDLSVLGNIPTLEEIDATDNMIFDISFIKDLKNMKIIVMRNNNISDISVFREFTTIEKIWLDYNDISDISPIAGNRGLLEVGFENCPIEGDIKALRGMDKIYVLNLDGCQITDISVLSTCTGLKRLYISYNFIEDFSPLDGFDFEEYHADHQFP